MVAEIHLPAADRSLPGTRVVIGRGCRREMETRLVAAFGEAPRAVVADQRVVELWRDDPLLQAPALGVVALPRGEAAKTPEVLAATSERLCRLGLPRAGYVVAIGGGAALDLAGLAAALHLRGVGVAHVPTTLLAMVDAALGGKCAVNLMAGKNLLGAFWPPHLLLADPELLTTLPQDELEAGLGEVAKYALGFDAELAAWILPRAAALRAGDLEALEHVVRRCLSIKAAIVGEDPFERAGGRRQLLNLGHTTAHALESLAAAADRVLPHGIAVALGLRVAAELAAARGRLSSDERALAAALLDALGLPRQVSPWLDPPAPADLLPYLARDKKRVGMRATVVLPRGLGACSSDEVELDELAARIARLG